MKEKNSSNRDSSIELFRIIVMCLIVAHHYVVNSNLMLPDGPVYSEPMSWRSIFLGLFGAWGKTGINCFIMITGYFMCTSEISIKKFVKLLLEVEFYKIICWGIFYLLGYETISVTRIIKLLLPITTIEQNFTGCYLVFFLFIPFLNILIKNMNEKQHIKLLMLCIFTYVFFGTIPYFNVSMNYVSWYMVLYFVSSYIRLYPKKIFENKFFWAIITLILLVIASVSVVLCLYNKISAYYFVADSNNFLAFALGISSFMFFKNLNLKYNKNINVIAGTTFGVLQIHANSDAMRTWLWVDVLKNVNMYSSRWLIIHAFASVLGIFVVCSLIDLLRKRFIEYPLFRFWNIQRERKKLK